MGICRCFRQSDDPGAVRFALERGQDTGIAARNGKDIALYDLQLRPLFDGPVTDLWYWGTVQESHHPGYFLKEIVKRNHVSQIAYKTPFAGQSYPFFSRDFVDSAHWRETSDSTFITIVYADGRRQEFSDSKSSGMRLAFPWYLVRFDGKELQYLNLKTGRQQALGSVMPTIFLHRGKEYRIVPQGRYDIIDDYTEKNGRVRSEKYESYLLTDDTGKELKRYVGRPNYYNGMILEKIYHPETNTYKGLRAEYPDGFQSLDSSVFAYSETRDGFLQLTWKDHSFLYFHPSGKLLYRGGPGELVYPQYTSADTLLDFAIGHGNGLMTMDGKVLIRLAEGGARFFLGQKTDYIQLHDGFGETGRIRHAVYHAGDQSLDVLDYSELYVLSNDPDLLLVKDSLDYKIIDGYGNVLDSLEVNWVYWIAQRDGSGIVVGMVPEKNPVRRRKKQKEIDRRLEEAEGGWESKDLPPREGKPWKLLYFNQRGEPIEFPEEYLLSNLDGAGIRFEAPSKPGYYGIMDSEGNVVVPNDYKWISYIDGCECFGVLDAADEIGYVRGVRYPESKGYYNR